MQPQPESDASSLVIEAWVPVLTPSLILHNLELHGIQPINGTGMTVTIDRGHYDCTGTNYSVIVVSAVRVPPRTHRSFCCSFFSRSATRGMDSAAAHSQWLGNCYVHLGHAVPPCSCRHESGRAKTWRRIDEIQSQSQSPSPSQSGAVSVEPVPVRQSPSPSPSLSLSPTPTPTPTPSPSPSPSPTPTPTPTRKNHLRIIQLQKKNLMLRTELDVLKSEFRDLKAGLVAMKEALGTVKEDQVGLAQRHKEQEATTKRANQCMQDWGNQQVIERLLILETQQSRCNSFRKKSKKELKRLLECNKCNKCNEAEPISWNPFDFKAIYDYCDQANATMDHATMDHATMDHAADDDDCPALDLIANHYADYVPCVAPPSHQDAVVINANDDANANGDDDDDDDDIDDDDLFQLIQVEAVYDFDFPLPSSAK